MLQFSSHIVNLKVKLVRTQTDAADLKARLRQCHVSGCDWSTLSCDPHPPVFIFSINQHLFQYIWYALTQFIVCMYSPEGVYFFTRLFIVCSFWFHAGCCFMIFSEIFRLMLAKKLHVILDPIWKEFRYQFVIFSATVYRSLIYSPIFTELHYFHACWLVHLCSH